MSELAQLRVLRYSGTFWRTEDQVNILWGELDWLDELHRLLYGDEK